MAWLCMALSQMPLSQLFGYIVHWTLCLTIPGSTTTSTDMLKRQVISKRCVWSHHNNDLWWPSDSLQTFKVSHPGYPNQRKPEHKFPWVD